MSNSIINFGIVSDIQYARQENAYPEKRPAPMGVNKLTDAIGELNTHELDFIINLGDTIDRDATNFPAIMDVFARSECPVWHALGNHDFSGQKNDKGYKAEALKALGMTDDSRYYLKDLNDCRFIVLDTNELGTIEHKKDSPQWLAGKEYREKLEAQGRINAVGWNGGLSNHQLQWLQEQIDDAAAQEMKVIIFAHHPIYPKHRENLLNAEEVLPELLERSAVKAYINGRNHDGNYGVVEGLHCWTIEGMMDYVDQTAYAIAKVNQGTIEVKGFGRVANRSMELR